MKFLHSFQLVFAILIVTVRVSKQRSPPIQICGKTNGCFKWPPGCTILKCKIVVRFIQTKDSHLSIEMSGKTDGWIAFGLNDKPRIMGGVQGEVCMKGASGIVLNSFKNEETDFHLKPLDAKISSIETAYSDGRLSCGYERPINSSTLKDVRKLYFLVASWGKTKMKGSKIHAHEHETGDYFWSESKVVLTKMEDVKVTTFGWNLIAVHGSLMIIAWIGFGFSAIFYARHMRDTWGQRKLCGTTLWFQAHRVSFFICTALVLIAFIIILAEVGGWNTEMEAHPVLGIMTIVLVCLQLLAGVLRPPVNSSKRIIFKYAHRITGGCTYILAVVTIFLGLSAMEVDIAVLIVYLVLILVIFVGYEVFSFYKSRTVAEVPYRDTEMDSVESDSTHEEESVAYSTKGMFARKTISLLVTGAGLGVAFIIVALIGHKGYVYHMKGVAE